MRQTFEQPHGDGVTQKSHGSCFQILGLQTENSAISVSFPQRHGRLVTSGEQGHPCPKDCWSEPQRKTSLSVMATLRVWSSTEAGHSVLFTGGHSWPA